MPFKQICENLNFKSHHSCLEKAPCKIDAPAFLHLYAFSCTLSDNSRSILGTAAAKHHPKLPQTSSVQLLILTCTKPRTIMQ